MSASGQQRSIDWTQKWQWFSFALEADIGNPSLFADSFVLAIPPVSEEKEDGRV
jgi:hypothetical protein